MAVVEAVENFSAIPDVALTGARASGARAEEQPHEQSHGGRGSG
jgi:hypothetical protein